MRWLSRLVTFAVIIAIVGALALLLRSKLPATAVGENFRAWALFRDGSRLAVGSQVVIAGVRVGEVEKLTIQDGFARVDLVLRDDTDIPADSWITKKATSAFGDSYLEIIPTTGELGAPPARKLRSGEQITHVQEGGSTDTALRAVAKSMPKLDQGLDFMHEFALDTRQWVNGPFVDGVDGLNRWLDKDSVSGPLDRATRGLERAERATEQAASAMSDAAPSVSRTLDRFDNSVTSARKRMADLRTGLHEGLEKARSGMDGMDKGVADFAEVVSAIDENRGTNDYKGTLGKLVNDPGLADSIEDVSEAGISAFAPYSRFKSYLGVRFEFGRFSGKARVYATAEIRARHDKFYLIEFEKGPLGSVPADSVSDVPTQDDWLRRTEIYDEIRFTAQFGKTLGGWFQVRGGIKDSTFGVGADALLYGGSLRLSSDLFGSYDRPPRLKLAAAFELFRYTYILAGVDDALNSPVYLPIEKGNTDVPIQFDQARIGRDYFVGASLHFTDEDLGSLIRIYGALLGGLLVTR